MAIAQILKVWQHEFRPNEQAVMLALADHAHEDGSCIRPSLDLVAWKTGYSKRNVRKIISQLRGDGVLAVVRSATHSTPNEYRFDWTKAKKKTPFNADLEGGQDFPPTPENTGEGGTHVPGGEEHTFRSGGNARSSKPTTEPTTEPKAEESAREKKAQKAAEQNKPLSTKSSPPDEEPLTVGDADAAKCPVEMMRQALPGMRIALADVQVERIRAVVTDRALWQDTLDEAMGWSRPNPGKVLDAYKNRLRREVERVEQGKGGAFEGWDTYQEWKASGWKPKHIPALRLVS